jgi:hypothetical protein
MGRQVLIDTNVGIGYIGGKFDKEVLDLLDILIESEFHLSIINKIELLGFPDLKKREEEQFKLFVENAVLHEIDDAIVSSTINIRKKYRIKLPDALIAATCLTRDLIIYTYNIRDFEKIKELEVIIPEMLANP